LTDRGITPTNPGDAKVARAAAAIVRIAWVIANAGSRAGGSVLSEMSQP
jgi:hypothetical protein